jgi:hypothetical protein
MVNAGRDRVTTAGAGETTLHALRPGIAVGCWLTAGALLLATAAAAGYDPLAADTWARWDSRHYLSIAGGGYDLEPCRVDTRDWCGNAGWFPAYPWLVSLLAAPGLSLAATAVSVSWLFSLATLPLLDRTFLRSLPVRARLSGLAFAAFVPGVVYTHAAFPLAMLGFFSVLSLWLLRQERWAWAGGATAVAAATYHLGVLLVPIAIVFAAASGDSASVRERLRRAAVVGGLAALGPLAVVGAMLVQTGAWDAWFLVQEKYGHGLHLPGSVLGDALSPLLQGHSTRLSAVPAAQVLFVAAVVGCVTWHTLGRRREADRTQWLLLGTTLALWLVPLTQENAGLYRTAAALLPAAPLVARLPAPISAAVGVSAAALSIPLAILFLRWQIV